MITNETHAEIRRLFFAEHFTVNAIASALGIHHSTVQNAIGSERFNPRSCQRKSAIDSYVPKVKEILEEYPRITATRLHQMLVDRGYSGSVRQLRRNLKDLRPRQQKAYFALRHLPGESAQVDWGSFGTIMVGSAKRTLSCFVIVLAYSKYMFARFTFDQTLESFLRCHVEAYEDFGGVARKNLYDNLKACVIERLGTVIRFNPAILDLAGIYHFKPTPCNIAAGWEKGIVERMIRYLRQNFYVGRRFDDLDDANRQLRTWLDTYANKRPWPVDRSKTVEEVFAEEKELLMPLPKDRREINHVRPIRSGKTPYIRFDLNDYSIPYKLVRQPLTLLANDEEIRLIDGSAEVARHRRCFDRGQRIENPEHIAGLLAQRKKAAVPKGRERILNIVPEAIELFNMLAEKGYVLSGNVGRMINLLDRYGEEAFRAAVLEAIVRKTPRASSIESILNRETVRRKTPPPLPFDLPEDPRVKDQNFVKSDLSKYDALTKKKENDDDE